MLLQETMGQRIKRLIKEVGLSQAEVARRIGVTRVTVNQWCLERSVPTPQNLFQFASLVGRDPLYIVYGPDREPEEGFVPPAVPPPGSLSPGDTGVFRSLRRRTRR